MPQIGKKGSEQFEALAALATPTVERKKGYFFTFSCRNPHPRAKRASNGVTKPSYEYYYSRFTDRIRDRKMGNSPLAPISGDKGVE
jgi:hypothetical protein